MLKAVTEEQKNFVLDKFVEYGEITDDGETLILYMEDDYYSIWLSFDEEIDRNTKLWRVEFDIKDGEFKEAHVRDYAKDDFRDTCKVSDYFDCTRINFFVDADTMDRAVKIASERFAAVKANEYIWLRLTRPYDMGWVTNKYETFNIKTNEFTKE